MKHLIFIITLTIFVTVSCRNQGFVIQPNDTIQEAFDKAYALFEEEKWADAANAFSEVQQFSRDTEIGEQTQYYLAESYFRSNQYMLAAAEFERYVSFYPNTPEREEAEFKIAISYYHQSKRFNLDQADTYQAIEQFRLFTNRFPNSERVEEAGNYLDELIGKLARKEYEAAEFYFRTNQFGAAALKYEVVLEQYPGSEWAERALAKQVEAYILYADNSIAARQAERYEQAIESYNRYLQLFPRGENRSRVEDLYDRAQSALASL